MQLKFYGRYMKDTYEVVMIATNSGKKDEKPKKPVMKDIFVISKNRPKNKPNKIKPKNKNKK